MNKNQYIEELLLSLNENLERLIKEKINELKKENNPINKKPIHQQLIQYNKIQKKIKYAYNELTNLNDIQIIEKIPLFKWTIFTEEEQKAKEFLEKVNQLINENLTKEIWKEYEKILKILK